MNLRMKTAMFAAMCCVVSTAAQADDYYVGMGMGGFSVSNGMQSKTTAGGYLQLGKHFKDWLDGEIRLGASGNVSVDQPVPARQRVEFVAHLLKPYIEVSRDLYLYGLAGFAVTHSKYQVNGGLKLTKNRISYAYGAGVEYRLNDAYTAGIDVWHMNGKPGNTPATITTSFQGLEATAMTAGIRYNF